MLLVQPVESTCDGPRRRRAIDSSLERLPCVPAVMEKSDAVAVGEERAVLLLDERQPPAAGAEATPMLRCASTSSGVDVEVAPARSASRDAASAIGTIRGTRRSSAGSMHRRGVEAEHLAAALVLQARGVDAVGAAETPLRPSRQARANASRPMPLGLTTPMPVMTTRVATVGARDLRGRGAGHADCS